MDDVEEKELIADFIAHDQSLTVEERRAERRASRLRMYRSQLSRMLKMLDTNAPPFLLALYAHNMHGVACGLWPEDMAQHRHDDFIRDVRRRGAMCRNCGDDLPLPYGKSEYCPACNEEFDNLEAQYCGDDDPEHGD